MTKTRMKRNKNFIKTVQNVFIDLETQYRQA